MNWNTFQIMPPYNKLILVRMSCGGVKLTMFEGMISDERGEKLQFNRTGHIFSKSQFRGIEEGVPTHWCQVTPPDGFQIKYDPTDIID